MGRKTLSTCINEIEESNHIKEIEEEHVGMTRNAKMYKVHEQLRHVNAKAYKPTLLAIGPYNNQDKVGQGFMKEHKLLYLQQMLKRTNGRVETYMEELRKLEVPARKCYVECIHQTRDQFVEMMILDGCFIIELFRKYKSHKEGKHDEETIGTDKHKRQDPIFQMTWMVPRIARDLLLFENQLPFFVLAKLFEIMSKSNGSRISGECIVSMEDKDGTRVDQIIREQISNLALVFFFDFLPFEWNVDASSYNSTEKMKDLLFRMHKAEFEHLLGLIHATISISILDGVELNHLHAPTEEDDWEPIPFAFKLQVAGIELNKAKKFKEIYDRNTNGVETGLQIDGVELNAIQKFKRLLCLNKIRSWKSIPYGKELCEAGVEFDKAKKFKRLDTLIEIEDWNIHSATELENAAIIFEKAEKSNSFAIKFNNRLMEISPLSIEDDTETCLRNLIAYEQYRDIEEKGDNCVTDYVCFMDNLINSPKDVELLRRKGIIQNSLGNDEATSTMVNKLGRYIVSSPSDSIYAGISVALNMHCRKRRYRWWATLKRDYFNTPWASFSFLAAALLLVLAIVQTVFSIIP